MVNATGNSVVLTHILFISFDNSLLRDLTYILSQVITYNLYERLNIMAYLSILLFAFFDYIFYNLAYESLGLKLTYRILQIIVQVGLIAALWIDGSFTQALVFFILWWTWIADFIYYAFYDLLGWFGKSKTTFKDEVLGDTVTWANWTPIQYITYRISADPKASHLILFMQGFIGLFISLLITICT